MPAPEAQRAPEKPQKPHLSHSQLAMLAKCGMQYFYAYVERRRRAPGVAALIGKATHKPIQDDLTAKKDTGKLLPDEQIADIARDSLRNNWAGEEPALLPDEKLLGVQKVQAEAIETAIALAQLHHRELAPKIRPVNLERPFRVVLNGFPYDLIGYWDIEEAPNAIRDTKTASKSPAEDMAERDVQLTIYAFSKKVIDGKAPDFVARDHLVKNKRPKVETRVAHPTEEDFKALLLRVEMAAKVIQAGTFIPTNPDNWWCSSKFCGYYDDICPFGARGRIR